MKTLTIIKAIGAGVTALYLGGKVANMARVTTTKTEVERQTAQQWHYAADEFTKALEELFTDHDTGKRDGLTVNLSGVGLNPNVDTAKMAEVIGEALKNQEPRR